MARCRAQFVPHISLPGSTRFGLFGTRHCRAATLQNTNHKLIEPNYQTSIAELFKSTAALILEHAGSHDYIGDTRRLIKRHFHLSDRYDLPSLVIDYSTRLYSSDLALPDVHVCHAAAETASNYLRFRVQLGILTCCGAKFQEIRRIQKLPLDETRAFYDFVTDFLEFWISLPQKMHSWRRMELLYYRGLWSSTQRVWTNHIRRLQLFSRDNLQTSSK